MNTYLSMLTTEVEDFDKPLELSERYIIAFSSRAS
jgi:hypothetical protein